MGEDSSAVPTAAYVAEFVGTFMLVFTVSCNILSGSSWAVTSIACVLMVAIYALGPVSGGHLNPAVSLGLGLAGKETNWSKILGYITMQVIGGLAAAFSSSAMFDGKTVIVGPKEGFAWWQVMLVESFYTCMLVFVVLNVATSKRNNPAGNGNQFYGLAIGFVIIAGGYASGGISGACFNPAVSLGLDFASWGDGVAWGFMYTIYQVIGAGVAALLFRVVRPEDFVTASFDDFANFKHSLPTRLACEFLGTYVLVFTVGMNVLGSSAATPWSAAAALMCMIYALGDVSGAHFNPAVTLAVTLSGKGGSLYECGCYCGAQVLGGLVASVLYTGVHDGTTFPLAVSHPYTIKSACLGEFIFTFMLCVVVLATAAAKGIKSPLHRNYYFGLAIGSCVTAGGFAMSKVSGGALNPAVSLAIAVSHHFGEAGGHKEPPVCAMYCFSQLAGGFVASIVFSVTHAKDYAAKSGDSS